MKEADLLTALLGHTGNLQPAPGASNAQVTDLRRAFAASLRAGQSPGETGSVASSLQVSDSIRADLEYLARAEPVRQQRTLIARRELALVGTGVPEWATGMKPSQTFGPFLDEFGKLHWFDLFTLLKPFRVLRGNQLHLVLPLGTKKNPNESSLEIPAGTVWIRGDQLTSAVPADAWVGIRVKGGTLGFPQASNLSADSLTVLPAIILKLQIDLDRQVTPGPADGPGSEATHSSASLPETARFAFGPLGVENISTTRASLTLYGNSAELTRTAAPAAYEAALRMVMIPMSVDLNPLKIGQVRSTLFKPGGSARIEKAAWGLTVTIAKPENLGLASGAGALVLATGTGLTASWLGLSGGEAALGKTFFAVDPAFLMVIAQQAKHFRGQQTVQLWEDSAGGGRHSTIEVQYPRPFLLSFFSARNGFDSLVVAAHLTGHLDRPLTVDGDRFPVDLFGSVVLLQKSDGTVLGIDGTAQLQGGFHPLAVALTNALLTITAPFRVVLNGTVGSDMQLDKGTLLLGAGVYSVLPILPDPYAANFEPRGTRDSPMAGVSFRATVNWPTPDLPSLEIALDIEDGNIPRLLPEPGREGLDLLPVRRGVGTSNYWLLDVSSGADQLGVALSIPSAEATRPEDGRVTIGNFNLEFPGNQLYTMLLPQFQWEAVYNTKNDKTFDKEGWLEPSVDRENNAIDGGPSFVRTQSARLIPLAPTPVAAEMVRAYTRDNAPSGALFTLPFGISARAALQDERYSRRPSLQLLRTRFDGLRSATQISLISGKEHTEKVDGNAVTIKDIPFLSGRAAQSENFHGSSTNNTLGVMRLDFNNTFTAQVPIERIDFSGYGASIFSRWLAENDPDVGITQVSFDAFSGRTSFERIHMVTMCWPCLSRFIRTIVLERQGGGAVKRWDSGWLSTTPGRFILEGRFEHIQKGVVEEFDDIRNIHDTDQIIDLPPDPLPAKVQAVYFDADVAFARVDNRPVVEAGQNSAGRVPAQRQLGFIQQVPFVPGQDFANTKVPLLTPLQLDFLIEKVGHIGGPIDCKIRIGRSRQSTRVTSIVTGRGGFAAGNDRRSARFAVAAYGSPSLPASGSWSMVRIDNGDDTVHPVDAERGVPLIRPANGAYRWADPEDLLHAALASSDYAFLMAHDAQRFLMPRPKIEATAANISSTEQPRVADPYSMLSSTGLFPAIDQVIKLPAATQLIAGSMKLAADNLKLSGPALGLAQKQLVNVQAWKEVADFSKATLSINSLDNWKIQLKQIEQQLEVKGVGRIMTVVHDFESIAGDPSKFLEPNIIFAPAIRAVADALDTLKRMAPNLPGGIGPFKLSASFSGTTFTLSAVADFNLATKEGDAVDCGMGKAKGNLKVGAELSADIGKAEIRGAVFLEIAASWQQEIFPALYAGGHLRFLIRAEQTGQPKIELDACAMGSIGGDLIPGLIEVEATVKYGYFIQLQPTLRPGLVVGMEGRAKLLSGLVGFKFGVEGRALIYPQFPFIDGDGIANRDEAKPGVRLYGRIRVAGTVTVAWAIEESKSFETDFDVNVDWKLVLLVAKAGLLPVP